MAKRIKIIALVTVVLLVAGFQFDRLRIGAVGGADPFPSRILKLTGTVTRSGNEATYTPPVTSVAGTSSQVTVTPSSGVYTVGLDESVARTTSVALSAAPIVITNATQAFATGTGTAVVTIKYRIITP